MLSVRRRQGRFFTLRADRAACQSVGILAAADGRTSACLSLNSHQVLTKWALEWRWSLPCWRAACGRRIPWCERFWKSRSKCETVILTPATNLGEFRSQELEGAKEWLIRLLEEEAIKNIVVDCQHMDYCGSTALALLATLGQTVNARHGRMVFCNVSSHTLEILKATNLVSRWLLTSTKARALEVIHSNKPDPPNAATRTCLVAP